MRLWIKKDKTYKRMFWAGVIIFILSNTYFGWNKEAQSSSEKVFDFIWEGLVIFGGIGTFVYDIVYEMMSSAIIKKDD